MQIRPENAGDFEDIRQITTAAFAPIEYSPHTEAAIVDALRSAGALTISLVAVTDGEVVGHLAFSPVKIDRMNLGWCGLGPVSVRPDRQNKGIGQALIREGLHHLAQSGAKGCVVLGEPEYYKRFGFQHDPGLRFEGAPAEYFMSLVITGAVPSGSVTYHAAFDGH